MLRVSRIAVVLACVTLATASAQPPVTFTDVAAQSGIVYTYSPAMPPLLGSGGAAIGDYNGDGFDDIYATSFSGNDRLYRNNGDGTFRDVAPSVGLTLNRETNAASWGDIDNDGDLDLFVTSSIGNRYYLYVNNSGHFDSEAPARGVELFRNESHHGYTACWGDYNRDGWLDLHVTQWNDLGVARDVSYTRLFRNRGAEGEPGVFEDVTDSAGVGVDPARNHVFSSALTDLDQDGWPDLVLGADFGTNKLFWNNGDGTFTDGTDAAMVGFEDNGTGMTFGDFDGDNDLDWLQTGRFRNNGLPTDGNFLYSYEAGRVFSDQADFAGVRRGSWAWGACFFDYDNDGDQDIVQVNGAGRSGADMDVTRFWENDGTGVMTERAMEVGLADDTISSAVHTFDYDNDGDLDVYVVNTIEPARLYRNDGGNANAWLRVRLHNGLHNTEGFNTKIWVTVNEGEQSQYQEMGIRSHYLGHSERVAHFGLGAGVQTVHELRVEWLDGVRQVFHDVAASGAVVLVERRADDPPMPYLGGLNEAEATQMIDELDLVLEERTVQIFIDLPPSTVIMQSPISGPPVPMNTVVDLILSQPTRQSAEEIAALLLAGFDAADLNLNGLDAEEAGVALPGLAPCTFDRFDHDDNQLISRDEVENPMPQDVVCIELEPEDPEGEGEGDSEGDSEGDGDGDGEGDGDGDGEGDGDGGCAAAPGDESRGQSLGDTILLAVLAAGFALRRRRAGLRAIEAR